jgi:hypothetical protein
MIPSVTVMSHVKVQSLETGVKPRFVEEVYNAHDVRVEGSVGECR